MAYTFAYDITQIAKLAMFSIKSKTMGKHLE